MMNRDMFLGLLCLPFIVFFVLGDILTIINLLGNLLALVNPKLWRNFRAWRETWKKP